MKPSFKRITFFALKMGQSFKNGHVILFCCFLPICVSNISAQVFEKRQPEIILRNGMVEPFSSQTPVDVYQSRHLHRSNVTIDYQYRNNVLCPEKRRVEIVSGAQNYQLNSRVMLNGEQNNGYYARTPQRMELMETKVTYNSFPTINSSGEVISVDNEETMAETGMMQALPSDWAEPGPIGDFVLPMLLFVGFYILVYCKVFKH